MGLNLPVLNIEKLSLIGRINIVFPFSLLET